MGKFIDASALRLRFSPYSEMQGFIDTIPAADVRPVIHGVWVWSEEGIYKCSECEAGSYRKTPFCCQCGADMAYYED